MLLPSGEKITSFTQSEWPSKKPIDVHVFVFQKLIVWPCDADARSEQSGENAINDTLLELALQSQNLISLLFARRRKATEPFWHLVKEVPPCDAPRRRKSQG
jgi:hypothetical protein